ncbi:uncharacterized protein KIAA2013 homolog isoform X3 [Mercenaria mercenaria]|uniref:uncharacterized protein KIAA2013 homolog isoform X3 n=1 Tax=Mercenaria mercenaria TaxID=6596 RepID=UPI00234EE10B|nr:uncharacterized protein KIAA2013 homolog isoform X3 [Mercenaria mercenaria]
MLTQFISKFYCHFESQNSSWPYCICGAEDVIDIRKKEDDDEIEERKRSRKIILGLFVLLVFLYYIVPHLFGVGSKKRTSLVGSVCLNDKLAPYQHQLDLLDNVLNYVPEMLSQKNYPMYVGNGYIAAAFDSQSGLYIRLNRALSLPVPYYPIVGTNIENIRREEVDVLQLRQGIANRLQIFNARKGCVSVESQLYAHRSRPSLMIQEIRLHNPTSADVFVDFDQVQASGWKDVQQSTVSEKNYIGTMVTYTMSSGLVKIEASTDEDLYVGVVVASTSVKDKQEEIPSGKYSKQTIYTVVQYTKAAPVLDIKRMMVDLDAKCRQEMATALQSDPETLKSEHTSLWEKLWLSGFSISYSRAANSLNGDKINSTIYYVLSNVPAPLHDPHTVREVELELRKTLHYPDKCYSGHTSLHSSTLWVDPVDEDSIARIVTTWIITLEKQGCQRMIAAGVDGVLQAMLLSIGSLRFGNEHLEMGLHPQDTHRDFNFHRINYGNNTHLNISVLVGDDNKANIYVSLDRNDKPYYACDAGCLDPPTQLSKERSKFPVKLTDPLTAILYITADKVHMEEYKHAIHVKEIVEAPAHEHHVIALHKHGHHFGGLPTIFWVSIAFLVIVFHLFLFKLIYNEYCQATERFTKSRYNL